MAYAVVRSQKFCTARIAVKIARAVASFLSANNAKSVIVGI